MELKVVNIIEIIKDTDRDIIECYRNSKSGSYAASKKYLIFPPYRNNKIRVSEQEARFLFVNNLEKNQVYYSVENPTENAHNFSSKIGNSRSAESDVMIWEIKKGKPSKQLNVEFKAKGVSDKRKDTKFILKDFKKILSEPCGGLWFHLLESVDSKTITKLFNVFQTTLEKIGEKQYKKKIIFNICILKQGISLIKELDLSIDLSIEDFFNFDYSIKKDKVKISNSNEWISI